MYLPVVGVNCLLPRNELLIVCAFCPTQCAASASSTDAVRPDRDPRKAAAWYFFKIVRSFPLLLLASTKLGEALSGFVRAL